jgi:hypothetical protein
MGGIGAIGGGACMGGMAGLGGASACGSAVPGSEGSCGGGINGMSPQMQQLVDLMGGMTSAQILMALMASRGGKGKDDDNGDPMAQLLGMAMGQQMAQLTQGLDKLLQSGGGGGQMESCTCGTTVGTQLNVMA